MAQPSDPLLWDDTRLTDPHAQADKALRVRRMFDEIAPTYELVNTVASAGRDAAWRRKMVRLTQVRPDDVLLDIACGTGDVARAYAAGDAGIRPRFILGLDFSLPMLHHAAARPIDGGVFCQGDALRLPVPDESVTITTCAFGIRNFQDLAAGLREMHRVLRPGGRAVLLEFAVPTGRCFRRAYLFYIRRIMPLAATVISRDRTGAYRYLPQSVLSFQGREAIVSTLRQAGFSSVSVRPLSLGIVSVYVAHKSGRAGPAS